MAALIEAVKTVVVRLESNPSLLLAALDTEEPLECTVASSI